MPIALPSAAEDESVAAVPAARSRYRWHFLAVLLLIYAVQHLDRQIVSILIEPLKREFGLSDTALGFLTGSCYAISYAIAGIPLGALGDRVNRRNLLAAVLAIWSGMTALSGLARNLFHLIVARLFVGAAESSNMPLAMSMMSDLFTRTERSRAFGIYWTGIAIGGVLGYAVGGPVAAAWGWRAAFLVSGVPGLVLAAVLILTMREPARRTADDRIADPSQKAPPFLASIRFFCSQRALIFIYVANAASSIAAAGISAWMPSFLIRVHGLSLHEAGIALGVVVGTGTTIGSLTGGFLGDWVARRDFLKLPLVPAVAIAVVALAGMGFVLVGSTASVVGLMVVWQIAQNIHSAPSYAVGQSLVGARMRGTANAVTLVISNLFGYGIGPGLIGYLSDLYAPWAGSGSIRYAMLTVTFVGILSALCFAISVRTLKRDLERAAGV